MLRNHKKHVGSPCRWLPFLGNRLLPWSIRREENFVMEKRLHLESGTGIMEHFHTFSSFWKYFFNKRSCSGTYPFRPHKWLLPPFPSASEPTFFFLRGERVSVHSLLLLVLLEVFRIVLTCVSTAFYPYLWWRFFQLTQFAGYERIFIFTFEGGGGVEFLEFDTRFSGRKKSLLCIFFNMLSIKDPSISVSTGVGLFLFLFLPALILPNSNCLHKILFAKEGIKIF